jgi:hypothetical protein
VGLGCVGVTAGVLTPGCFYAAVGLPAVVAKSGFFICNSSAEPSPYHIFGAAGTLGAGESPQFSPGLPGDAIPTDGWFPFSDVFNGVYLLGPAEGTAGGEWEVSLGDDAGGHGVLPDNGALVYGGGPSGGEVALGGDVSVGSGGYMIGNPDPNDDQGGVPTDIGGD